MKILFALMLIPLVSSGPGCCSRETAQKAPQESDAAGPAGREAIVREPHPTPPAETTLKRNGASVAALVESVSVLGDDMYTLFVRLDSAVAIEGMDSPAVQGQWLTLSPGYVLDEKGQIDRSNERNKRLMSLRSLKQGDQFKGRITLEKKNGWVLVDVEQ